jgi:hypothetical protein
MLILDYKYDHSFSGYDEKHCLVIGTGLFVPFFQMFMLLILIRKDTSMIRGSDTGGV